MLVKGKLEGLREQINQRVFADRAKLRHNEHMGFQQAQLLAQQQTANVEMEQSRAIHVQANQIENTQPINQVEAPRVARRSFRWPEGSDARLTVVDLPLNVHREVSWFSSNANSVRAFKPGFLVCVPS